MGILRTAGRAAVASSVHGRVQRRQRERWAQQPTPAAPAPPPPSAPPPGGEPSGPDLDAQLAQLAKLGELRDAGILTDAEFEAKKSQVLGR